MEQTAESAPQLEQQRPVGDDSLTATGWRAEPMKISHNPAQVTGGDAQHAAPSASRAADAAPRPFSEAAKPLSDRTNCPKRTAKTAHADPFHPLIIAICSPGVQLHTWRNNDIVRPCGYG